VYPDEELMRARLDLLYPTNMVDFAMDVWKNLHKTDEVPEAMAQRRQEVLALLHKLDQETAPLREVLDDAALVEHLRAEKNFNLAYLAEKHQLQPEALPTYYEWARFQFECGNYGGAATCLQHFRMLSTNAEASFNALWGKLAAEILVRNFEAASEDLSRLREAIEGRASTTPPLMQLQQRSWLMHWSLYVFFYHENGRASLVDLFFNDRYMNALVTNCPHLLRYLVAAFVLTAKRRRALIHELTRVCVQEAAHYSDPLTRFVKALNADCDFDAALAELEACDAVMEGDHFLSNYKQPFQQAAKGLLFESYCRIHRRIDIRAVATKLKMEVDDAERWVVNLVRDAHLAARIDSTENHVVLSSAPTPVYQKVIEKTIGVQFRSTVLASTIEQCAAEVSAKAAAAAATATPR
jgi:translation initiation factor 3 subunit E